MGDKKKSKGSKSLFRGFRSASDSNLAKDPLPVGLADSRLEQSSGEQRPQQAALSPPIASRSGRIVNWLERKSPLPSRLPSPSPEVDSHNSATDSQVAASTRQPLRVPASASLRPHNSCSGTSARQAHEPTPTLHDPSPLASGDNVPTRSSGDHSSPSSPDVQGSSFAPTTQVSYPISEPTTSNDTAPSTCAAHTQVQAPARIGAHTEELPTLTSDPDTIEPLPHSSVVWAKALEIARKKLGDNNLPHLDITNLTSESAEKNVEAVVNALIAFKEDDQKKRWKYTWRGKEVVVVERLGKILRSVEKYSKVVDTIIQVGPQVSAIVWAGIRAIIQVRIQCTLSVDVNALKLIYG